MKRFRAVVPHFFFAALVPIVLAGCASTRSAPIQMGEYPVPAVDGNEAAKAIKQLEKYRFGDSRVPVALLQEMVRESLQSPESRALMATMLGELLEGDATLDGKRIACRHLSLIGTQAQVPQLAPLLTDETLSDFARYALERIPGEAVDLALVNALSTTSGKTRIGIINSLGVRGAPSARPELRALRNDRDPATAEAARAALRRRAPSPPG